MKSEDRPKRFYKYCSIKVCYLRNDQFPCNDPLFRCPVLPCRTSILKSIGIKWVEVALEDNTIDIELKLEDFLAISERDNWSPIKECNGELLYLDPHSNIIYYAKKSKA